MICAVINPSCVHLFYNYIHSAFCTKWLSFWRCYNISLQLLTHSLTLGTFHVSARPDYVFYCVFHVPGCPHRCTETLPSLRASSVLIWSLFGLFTAALWIKLLSAFTGSAQRNITTGPLMLPNWAFPNWFSQNLPIYRDEFRKSLSSLSPSRSAGRPPVGVVAQKKVILNLTLQKGSFVNPKVASEGREGEREKRGRWGRKERWR